MKTKNKNRKFSLLVILVISISPIVKAQSCSMSFVNTMTCTANVTVDWFTSCPGAPCDSQTFNVPPNSSNTTATCNGCGTICDVEVTINTISGSGVTPNGNNYVNSASNTDSGTCVCSPVNTYNMQISSGIWNISF